MIIGISGEAGSGKTTLAKYLVKAYGFKEVAFADKLKEMIGRALFDLSDSQLYGHLKEHFDPRYDKSPREILQLGGELMRCIHKDIWIEAAFRGLDFGPDSHYVVSDARYVNELEKIRSVFCGDLWLMRRPGAGAKNGIAGHASEEEFKNFQFDSTFDNDGTLDDLYLKADKRMALWGNSRRAHE